MFSILDLIPIGIVLIIFSLCIFASFKAKGLPPKIISIVTGLVFLSAIPLLYLMRYNSLRSDYTTTFGMSVKVGKKNVCQQSLVDTWEQEITDFWQARFPNASLLNAFEGKYLICWDEEKFNPGWSDKFFKGYFTGKHLVIGYSKDIKTVRKIYRHEMSHMFLASINYPWDKHHGLFKSLGLVDG